MFYLEEVPKEEVVHRLNNGEIINAIFPDIHHCSNGKGSIFKNKLTPNNPYDMKWAIELVNSKVWDVKFFVVKER